MHVRYSLIIVTIFVLSRVHLYSERRASLCCEVAYANGYHFCTGPITLSQRHNMLCKYRIERQPSPESRCHHGDRPRWPLHLFHDLHAVICYAGSDLEGSLPIRITVAETVHT